MAEQIRTFIAIELDEEHNRALDDVQAQFKRERVGRYVRWVAPENIHLTLKFIGNADADKMPSVQRAIADACTGIAPFMLSIAGVGVFPNARRPNVIWVGMGGQVEIAARLAQKIEDACAALGFAREDRPFTPHLTLGRVKRDASTNDRRLIGEMIESVKVGALGELRVAHVSVMKSVLQPTGSVYTRLYAIGLKA